MKSDFSIFVVFAVVSLSSFTLQSSSVDKDEIQANFSIIQSGQEVTLAKFDTAFNGIFDIVSKFAKARLGNADKPRNLSWISEALKKKVLDAFSEAHVVSMTAIAIVQPDTSVTVDWEADRLKLEQVINGTYAAILLSTNRCGTLAEIEEIENEVTDNMVNIFKNIYKSIESGRSNQTDVVCAIVDARAKAVSIVRTAYSAIFSTIKILFKAYSDQIPTGLKDVLSATKFARSLVSSVTRDEVRNKYALIRIIFIFSLIDDARIVTDFSTIQSREKDVLSGYKAIFEPLFNILYKLTETVHIAPEIRALHGPVFSGFKDIYIATIEAFQIIQKDNSSTIPTDENMVDAAMNTAVDDIINAILDARSTNSCRNLAKIEAIGESVVSQALTFYGGLYAIIANISSSQDDVAAAIESFRIRGLSNIEIAFRNLFAAIKIVATENSSKNQHGTASVSFAIEAAENVVFFRVNDETALKFALIRNLYIFNTLSNNGVALEFPVSVIG